MFWENAVGVSQNMVNAGSFDILAIVFGIPENLLVVISGAVGMKEKPLSQG